MSKIDTHHHFVPQFYAQAVEDAGGDPSGWPTPRWTPEASLTSMDKNGTKKAILSLTAPGAVIAPDASKQRALARQANEYAASLRDTNPERFGFFAALPCLLDTAGTLAEIQHSLDVLHAEGVTLFTRYGPGNQYLGHPAFKPIWEELNARKAVVFIHPTHPADTNRVNPQLPQPAIDYPHETTRTAVDLLTTGTKRAYPDCKVILSHAGGTLPYLISRLTTTTKSPEATYKPYTTSPEEMVEDFKSFYFDLALSSSPAVLALLLSLVPYEHILYGREWGLVELVE
ncbi:2-amino-3-carboxymuconate-6-semialdehyde decarboxylase [Aspergillus heteromorphus CBS 117.55]|uniref:6-methylsalicylate decarboxylase n=1 Tax=Aspergillus heteromorphus CBS 117.55 TaxID=1448321 RepID=A0A317V4N0_9EURO|nr:2-amino-3-carboxymuconate-6-semialdehyde decarboxylase [Aspergillus heteromorphus CBS 117.55]PWY68599.1 2-amino-3-carboxymuconate-6-semialdehyde decarboxylase [Aspergillus heteromorphus CBS 117.55]